MEQAAPVVPSEAVVVAEGEVKPQEGQQTEQKPAPEVAQEPKEGEEKHRSRAYRRLDRWRTRAIEAEARLKAFQEFGGQERKPAAEMAVDDAPKREQFENYEDYIRADARYHAGKEAEERARKVVDESRKKDTDSRQKQTQEKQAKEWTAKIEKARDAIEDFDEVMSDSEAPMTEPMAMAIQDSDQAGFLAYYLAKNPAEAERISKLTPSKQVAAIVALEEKVAKPVKKPSTAPEPITPVGQKAEVEKDPAKMSQAEYNAWRRKQVTRRQ